MLVDTEIEEAISIGEVEVSDFSKECLMPASYDLRVGEEGFVLSAGRVIDIRGEGPLEVQPGDFALVMTHEKLRLSTNMVGRFGLRSVYARIGLLLTAGLQVDPGFEGKLVVGIVNFSSQTVRLPYLTPFCTLELEKLRRHSSAPYRGPYQGQEHLTDEIINTLPKEQFPLAVMLIRQLAAASPSLRLPEAPTVARRPPEQLGIFEREKAAFERLKRELLKTHRGQYVVVRDEKAVLFGQDKTELAKQAYQKFGYGSIYIGLVQDKPEAVHIPTPRVPRRVT